MIKAYLWNVWKNYFLAEKSYIMNNFYLYLKIKQSQIYKWLECYSYYLRFSKIDNLATQRDIIKIIHVSYILSAQMENKNDTRWRNMFQTYPFLFSDFAKNPLLLAQTSASAVEQKSALGRKMVKILCFFRD